MKKPQLKQQKPAYDWSECEDYIKKKYKKDIHDWAAHCKYPEKPYQNFWHFIYDICEVGGNGCYLNIPFYQLLDNETTEDWQKEIIRIFMKEFESDEGVYRFWVEW